MKIANIYGEQLQAIEEAEMKVRVAKRNLKEAERELDETLELVEARFVGGEECVIEIMENGRWRMVGYDKNDPRGWSTNPTKEFKVFTNEDKARGSKIFRDLAEEGKVEEVDFRINNTDGSNHR